MANQHTANNPRSCAACQQSFTCGSAYQMHLLGRRGIDARCRSVEEMLAIGMAQNAAGVWKSKNSARRAAEAPRIKPGHRPPFV